VTTTEPPITPATSAEWRRRREADGNLPPDGRSQATVNGFRVPAHAATVRSQDVASTGLAQAHQPGSTEAQQAGLLAMINIANTGVLPSPHPATEPRWDGIPPAAVTERPEIRLYSAMKPPGSVTAEAGEDTEPAPAPTRSDAVGQLRAVPLTVILTVQAVLSLRLVTGNTAFTDEALYLWAGRLEWSHWLHHTPVPAFASYFSGAPVLYPPVGALADSLGGLAGARILSLCFVLGATVLLHGVTRRIFDRQSAVFAAALFAALGSAQFIAAFATYDAMALFLLATSTWLGIRAASGGTTGSRLALVLLAAVALALANATKYAAAVFDPAVLIAIASFHWRERGRGAGLAAGALASGGTAAGIAVGLAWGGAPYVTGILSTTLSRPSGNWPIFGILFVGALWGGIVAAVAVIGAIAASCAQRAGPQRVLAWTLAAAAFLAPAEQARIHVYTSLFKHVGFGGWFAAVPAGYALTAFIRAVPAAKSRGAIQAGLSMVILTWIVGLLLATDQFGSWENVNPLIPALTATLRAHPGSLLVDVTPPFDYYLIGSEPWQQIAAIPRTSPQAEAQLVRRRHFSVILLSYTIGGGGCGNEDPSVKSTQATCPHNVDLRMLSDLLSSGGYRLADRIPYRTSAFRSAYTIWVREGPR
jgi:4-amino-4-deoxy-L-arabinose transferase-like glycosyltransferase